MNHPFQEVEAYGGIQRIYTFDNGYGASAISHPYSRGGREGLWEVAVLRDGVLCYSTPITDDVIGCLDESERDDVLERIAALEAAQ